MSNVFEQFVMKPKEYVIVSGCLDAAKPRAFGKAIHVPSRVAVGDSPLVLGDEKIPGTVVVKDVLKKNEFGQLLSDLEWSATEAVKLIFNIDSNGTVSGGWWDKGLALIVGNPTKEAIEQARLEAVKRNSVFQVAIARQIVAEHNSMNAANRKANMPEAPGDEAYFAAKLLLHEYDVAKSAEVKEKLGIKDIDPLQDVEDLATQLAEAVASKVQAKRPDLTREEIIDSMLDDPEFMKQVIERRNSRKNS